jgi:glycosyltransferase involved in cell wall biosynthesis
MEVIMKKKILHVLSSQSYSGAENVATVIITNLNKDYDMAYSSPDGPIRKTLEDREVLYIPMKDFTISSIRKVIKEWKPDLLHTHDFTATLKCILVSRKIPIIAHIHQNPTWLRKVNFRSIIFSLASKKISTIVTVNPAIFDSSILASLYKDKTKICENIVDIKFVNEKAKIFSEEKFDLLFVGRLVEIKDPLRFIKIAAMLINKNEELKAVIIGDGLLKVQCEAYIKELGMEGKIILKGHLDNPFPIIGNSKILVMTSKSEGLPMTAIEAQALGKPIVVPEINGINRVVDHTCGIVCKDDNEYINGITNILQDEKKYLGMSRMAKRRAQSLFNMDVYNSRIINIYNRAFEKK